eukprot:CAMPEP_0202688972 /NCGR_PEP_ID=MMETSP1385-20130828/4347_1 /ASSEMBLY_ACC=CAM_ASM_000861 /TAXON_ID=933848 /ORGANISM="Elphidium margaritaceum" /LENGTH=477 /DNA_ID=CAMNT_0049344043 /DNA_START=56 /DNA_END=1489 /DNA_ORIENTATION=-
MLSSFQLLSYALCALYCTLSVADESTRRLLQFPANTPASNGPQVVEINGQWFYLVPPPNPSPSPPTTLPQFAPVQTTTNTPNAPQATTGTPAPGQVYGVYGQFCPVVSGGGPLQCNLGLQTITSDLVSPNTAGSVTCSNTGDCCQCGTIQCGDPLQAASPCLSFSMSGDSSAYGVRDIQIYGNSSAQVQCGGQDSCRNARIVASDIRHLSCSGKHSCQDAEIVVNEPAVEMMIDCGVTSSCENLQLTLNFGSPASAASNVCTDPALFEMGEIRCVGVNACRNMTLTVNNYDCKTVVFEMIECRQGSCDGATWNFYGTSPVGIASCSLPNAVLPANSGLNRCFTDLQMLSCSQPNACMGQVRTIIDPQTDYKLDCVNTLACSSAQFTIRITPATNAIPVEHLYVYCDGEGSCMNMKLNIINNALSTVYVSVYCSALGACDNAVLTGSVNVEFAEVKCGNLEECANCLYNGQQCGNLYL